MQTKQLKDFCKKARKLPKSDMPVTENLLFQNGMITATNLEQAIIFKDAYFSGEGLIDLNTFYKLIKKSDDIDIKFNGKTASIKTPKGLYSIETDENIDDFPNLPEVGKKKFQLTEGDISNVIKASNYVAFDDIRPVMQNILLDEKNIVGTDAHYLARYNRESKGDTIKISRKITQLLEKEALDYKPNKNFNIFEGKNYLFYDYKIEARYPDYQSIFPQEKEFSSVTVKSSELKEVLLDAEPAIGRNMKITRLFNSIGKSILNINCRNNDTGISFNTNLRVDNEGEDIQIGVDQGRVLDVINTENTEYLTFKFYAPNRAMLINDNIILMPACTEDVVRNMDDIQEEQLKDVRN